MVTDSTHPSSDSQGRIFTPRLATDSSYRFTFLLSAEDLQRFAQLQRQAGEAVTITDQATGLQWLARPADCGADCFCDAEVIPVEHPLGFDALPQDVTEAREAVQRLMQASYVAAQTEEGDSYEAAVNALEELIETAPTEVIAEALIWAAEEALHK